jgi:hypothetical protein
MKTLAGITLIIVMILLASAVASADPFTIAPIYVGEKGDSNIFLEIFGPGYSHAISNNFSYNLSTVWLMAYTGGATFSLADTFFVNGGATIYLDGTFSLAGGTYLSFKRFSWLRGLIGPLVFYAHQGSESNTDFCILTEAQLKPAKWFMLYGDFLIGENAFNAGMQFSF